ncbi:MAG: ABC transporter permease [Acidobacteriaceae bacterium]
MAGNEAFEMVTGSGWSRGLENMLRSGFTGWFRTRTWWTQCLIWAGIINLILAAVAFNPQAPDFVELLMLFAVFASLFPAVGVVILMQDSIVGEKREGTAAWVLSKPVTRHAFVLSKVVTNAIGVLATMIIVPGSVAYIILSVFQRSPLDPLGFLEALGVIFANHLFFLTLTLMLGTLFNVRGPVIGIPLGILFFQQNLIGFMPFLRFVLPWPLTLGVGNTNSLIFSLLTRTPIQPEMLTILAVILGESLLFVLISLWRFNREEL